MDTSMRDMLIKDYHLETLPEDKQNDMIERIGSLIFQAVMLRAAPQLSDESQTKLEGMFTSGATPDEVMAFLNAQIPGFENIIKEESATFKKESDAVMSQLGK